MSNLTVTGYAAVFGNVDSVNDVIVRGAFRKALKVCQNMPLLYSHKNDEPIGRILKAEEDWYGLWVTLEVFEEIAKGKDVIALHRGGMRLGLSIGYRAMKYRTVRKEATDARFLEELSLIEISVVTNPANDMAMICEKRKKK